jgi:hypothetical protein
MILPVPQQRGQKSEMADFRGDQLQKFHFTNLTDSSISSRLPERGLVIVLMMKAVGTSETSVYFNETTLRYVPDSFHR